MFSLSNASEGRRLDMSSIREWAQEIASSYLSGSDEPTPHLQKLASAEELTPHQIELVATEANKEIHRIKFASASDKYFAADFPLADAKVVIKALQATDDEIKVAGYIPAPIYDKPDLDYYKALGVEPEAFNKTAAARQLKGDMRATLERCELVLEKSAEQIEMRKAAVETSEQKFLKEARQYVLSMADNEADRLKAIGDISKVAAEIKFSGAQKALAKLAFILGKEGLLSKTAAKDTAQHFMKKAQSEIPEEMIDRNFPGVVVNGVHPIYTTLRTFNSHSSALEGDLHRRGLIQDKVTILRQKMRVL